MHKMQSREVSLEDALGCPEPAGAAAGAGVGAFPAGTSVMVQDALAAPGGFLLVALLRVALQAGHRVVLVALDEPPAHYAAALRKAVRPRRNTLHLSACARLRRLSRWW